MNASHAGQLLGSVYDQLNMVQLAKAPDVGSRSLLQAIENLAIQVSSNDSSNPMTHYYRGIATEASNGSWQTSLVGLIDSLPMPTDEATMNSELGLGPIRDPLWTAIPMTVLYVLILVTGVVGNVLTCVVIVRNRYMHTATNYYLFSLAISDLLLLVLGLPQEIQQIWQRYPYAFGEVFCVLRGFSSEASTNSSVLTITAFTMERYVAICHPLKAHTMSKLSRAMRLIVIIWLLGFLCAAPIAYQFGIVFDYVHDEVLIPQSAKCNIKRPVPYLEEHIFALQSLLVFVIPVTVISLLYTLIGVKLRQSSQSAQADMSRIRRRPIKRQHSWIDTSIESGDQEPHLAHDTVTYTATDYRGSRSTVTSKVPHSITSSPSSSLSQRRAVIKMLTAVVVAFFVCFAPFHAQRLMAIYVKNPSHYETFAFNMLTYISGVTYYLSATINPILYSIMSVRFRQAFHDTFMRTLCPTHSGNGGAGGGPSRMGTMYCSNYRYSHPLQANQTIVQKNSTARTAKVVTHSANNRIVFHFDETEENLLKKKSSGQVEKNGSTTANSEPQPPTIVDVEAE